MCDIYRDSALTISAACSSSDISGFLREPRPFHLHPDHKQMIQADPIHTRAWTFQEHILPRCLLSFGSHEMYWECEVSRYCLCGAIDSKNLEKVEPGDTSINAIGRAAYRKNTKPVIKGQYRRDQVFKPGRKTSVPPPGPFSGYFDSFLEHRTEPEMQASLSARFYEPVGSDPDPWKSNALVGASFYHYWHHTLVPEYTRRQLTKASDKLIALQAIATDIQSTSSDVYLAGLWRGDLGRQLCWASLSFKAISTCNETPSWSWASVSGPVGPYPADEPDLDDIADSELEPWRLQILRVYDPMSNAAGSSMCGAVVNSFLRVRGSAILAFASAGAFKGPDDYDFKFYVLSWDNPSFRSTGFIKLEVSFCHDTILTPGSKGNIVRSGSYVESDIIPRGQVVLFVLKRCNSNKSVILVLSPADPDEFPPRSFRRIGIGQCPWSRLIELSNLAEEKEFLII